MPRRFVTEAMSCRKGDLDKALADCIEAIFHNPQLAFAYSLRGFIYAKRGSQEMAIADYTEAVPGA